MRPRRHILLWSEFEAVGEEYGFLLRTAQQLTVDHCTDVDEFTARLIYSNRAGQKDYSLVILIAGEDQDLLARLSVLCSLRLIHIPTLIVLTERAHRRVDFLAEQVLHFPVTTPQLFEAVLTLCARKRGPKKLQRATTQELVGS